jgi:threonine/homoserine/homoserine lactone efflux protein
VHSVGSYLVFGITYAFAAAVQPGPFQTYLVSETMVRGWRRTLPAAFAPLISDAPIFVLAMLVLSRMPPALVRFLHLGGGLFLFYLAYGAYRTWRSFDPARLDGGTDGRPTLMRAAIVNFLNPNPWLGWSLVMGPLFIEGYRESPANGLALVIGFYTTMIACTAGLITLFAFARGLGPRVSKATLGLSVIALAGFGVYQLWLGLRAV